MVRALSNGEEERSDLKEVDFRWGMPFGKPCLDLFLERDLAMMCYTNESLK